MVRTSLGDFCPTKFSKPIRYMPNFPPPLRYSTECDQEGKRLPPSPPKKPQSPPKKKLQSGDRWGGDKHLNTKRVRSALSPDCHGPVNEKKTLVPPDAGGGVRDLFCPGHAQPLQLCHAAVVQLPVRDHPRIPVVDSLRAPGFRGPNPPSPTFFETPPS